MALKGEIKLPGDKSISHRALMLNALGDGQSRISNLNPGADVQTTRDVLVTCGIQIEQKHKALYVQGGGLRPFSQPEHALDCGNSGTTTRLMMGLLAAHPIHVRFEGDQSLSNRPMDRVFRPLQQMGANVSARDGRLLPVMLSGRDLWALDYTLPFASAQVKSAILLAGLHAKGETAVHSPAYSRDHTEQMLKAMGADITVNGRHVTIKPLTRPLHSSDMEIPGDFSAAAFFITAGLIVPDSDIILRKVGVNPSRTAFLTVLEKMGADITVANQLDVNGEAVADLRIRSSALKGIVVPLEYIANMIDELPLLALLATQAEGETEVRGAEELRVKESDRIKAIVENMANWGATIFEREDGFSIEGPTQLEGGKVTTFADHRIAMTMSVGGLIASKPAVLDDARCMDISHPGFLDELRGLSA
ncbi:MAG: 3-phosphoshikimate 1-carboxyvinyltransferase [Candidatus Marinimicrobia bacterium]|nr:3-phosphoshikimate 1-carboxyvinyltransferase [Candidatus Neomarinimicrobiota bacterium]MCF7850246.1 3-phosphoshikimate 1-carboxyvinyltransferase [Candidatus Neomarinimicrobiota bacterium]MCF7903712.1 3-phosphoshikimate 1-carboxyvinyltransferase [Candidatus Neomarinimicrobiota bacterium]